MHGMARVEIGFLRNLSGLKLQIKLGCEKRISLTVEKKLNSEKFCKSVTKSLCSCDMVALIENRDSLQKIIICNGVDE